MTTDMPRNPLLHAAGIVGRGFLLGVGFSFALGIAVVIGSRVSSHRAAEKIDVMQEDLGGKDFENHDKFVDQYSTYLTGAIGPGKSQYFKISCGCKDSPPAEHDSYKLEVLGGY
jgi:hypothetical protein